MERRTRLHLGSGKHYWPGWINRDFDERADVVADATKLPDIEDGSVDEIQAIHVFEHFDRNEVVQILKEWGRVLKPGGRLVLEMPCLNKIAQLVIDGANNPVLIGFGLYGDIREESPYMRHQWCYTYEEIQALFEKCGFDSEIEEPAFHLKQRDMRITGVKR